MILRRNLAITEEDDGSTMHHWSYWFAKWTTIFLIVFAAASTSARTKSSRLANEDNSVYAELGKAPQKAAKRENPLQDDPEAVAAGEKLFALHCAECHGEMAEGGRKAPSLLADPVQQATPGTLFWILTNGVVRRGMPVWSKLPEPQRWQLVRYIESLGPAPKSPRKGRHQLENLSKKH
jgi:mono/diheme cytochrome c family protein